MRAAAAKSTMNSRADNVRTKNLRDLLADSGVSSEDFVPPDLEISDLTLDSRAVTPGAAFVALPGSRTHGIGFAAQLSKPARALFFGNRSKASCRRACLKMCR